LIKGLQGKALLAKSINEEKNYVTFCTKSLKHGRSFAGPMIRPVTDNINAKMPIFSLDFSSCS